MAEFFDYDPVTGITEYFDYDEQTGTAYIRSVQDVSAFLDRNKEMRNTGIGDIGIKNGMWHVASIPPVVQLAIMKRGIDFFDPDNWDLIAQIIERDYPYLKTTDKRIV